MKRLSSDLPFVTLVKEFESWASTPYYCHAH
jgi:hypothetical protein